MSTIRLADSLSEVQKIKSINPATLEVLGEVPQMSAEQVKDAVAAARRAQPSWEALGFRGRVDFILRLRDLIFEDMDPLAELISKENGKPKIEAIGHDILPALDLMTFFAKKSEKILRKEKIKLGKWGLLGHRSHLEYYPYGVIGVIAPWNFPFSIPMGEVVMALVVGNTVVLKPSEFTSLVALKIREYCERVSLPQDVLRVVTGDGRVGAALVQSGVDKIAFTGSVATGKKIMAACAENLTPLTLELGGKDPLIVCKDADLDTASSAAVWGAFCNSGQICASIERVYVDESVKQPFIDLVIEKTKKLRQGVGQSYDVDIGAMTAEMQLKKVSEHVEDAKKRGAKIWTGGKRGKGQGYFYEPTVLTEVDHSFLCVAEESFGPTMPIMTFKDESEAIQLANDSPYALNAYVWSRDTKRARKLASKLVAGTVNINDSIFTHAMPQTPWGGPKWSGLGRTHGELGLLDLVQVRHIHLNTMPFKKTFFWWFGYSREKTEMLKTFASTLFTKGFTRLKSLLKLIKMMVSAKVD